MRRRQPAGKHLHRSALTTFFAAWGFFCFRWVPRYSSATSTARPGSSSRSWPVACQGWIRAGSFECRVSGTKVW